MFGSISISIKSMRTQFKHEIVTTLCFQTEAYNPYFSIKHAEAGVNVKEV